MTGTDTRQTGSGPDNSGALPRTVELYPGMTADMQGICPAWRNRLIMGDNLDVLKALQKGTFAADMAVQGKIRLVYIDPPFNAGIDFFMNNDSGQRLAYPDKWPSQEKYLAMLSERLMLIRELIAPDGCIYVHCDWRANAWLRMVLERIFAVFVNEIIWHYTGGGRPRGRFANKHDTIFLFAKSKNFTFNPDQIRTPYKSSSGYARSGITARNGKHYQPNPAGTVPDDVWDIPIVNPMSAERTGYPTQKPEALLERIIRTSSSPGDLVADFFCGSGTLPAVAEKLGRRWLAVDSGIQAIHTTRKRLLQIRSGLTASGREPAAFEIMRACSGNDPLCQCASARVCPLAHERETRRFRFSLPDNSALLILVDIRSGAIRVSLQTDTDSSCLDRLDCWAVDLKPMADFSGYPFIARWHSCRTRGHPELALSTPYLPMEPDQSRIAIMVFDNRASQSTAIIDVFPDKSNQEEVFTSIF